MCPNSSPLILSLSSSLSFSLLSPRLFALSLTLSALFSIIKQLLTYTHTSTLLSPRMDFFVSFPLQRRRQTSAPYFHIPHSAEHCSTLACAPLFGVLQPPFALRALSSLHSPLCLHVISRAYIPYSIHSSQKTPVQPFIHSYQTDKDFDDSLKTRSPHCFAILPIFQGDVIDHASRRSKDPFFV